MLLYLNIPYINYNINMDIKGIGIDIVSTKRIKNKLYLVDKFLTEEELKYFNSLEDLNGKIEFASGR